MYKEAAVENFTDIPAKLAAGADRIELNDNLAVGGTTVSRGVMAESALYVHEHNKTLATMIRPRGGNFVYNDTEIKMMEADIFEAQALGVDAVVFGALTEDGSLDTQAMENLISASAGMDVVFHMAFDAIPDDKQKAAIDWLVEHGVTRILTHGGSLDHPIEEMLPRIKQIIEWADGRIEILPGGGVRADNAEAVATALGVTQLHGTKIV